MQFFPNIGNIKLFGEGKWLAGKWFPARIYSLAA